VHGDHEVNCFRIMFAAEKDGKTFYACWNGSREKTVRATEKEIGAGEKFEENFLLTLPFDQTKSEKPASEFYLPELRTGESLKLFFGLCSETDPRQKSWALADTVKSGAITVTRATEEGVKP